MTPDESEGISMPELQYITDSTSLDVNKLNSTLEKTGAIQRVLCICLHPSQSTALPESQAAL